MSFALAHCHCPLDHTRWAVTIDTASSNDTHRPSATSYQKTAPSNCPTACSSSCLSCLQASSPAPRSQPCVGGMYADLSTWHTGARVTKAQRLLKGPLIPSTQICPVRGVHAVVAVTCFSRFPLMPSFLLSTATSLASYLSSSAVP